MQNLKKLIKPEGQTYYGRLLLTRGTARAQKRSTYFTGYRCAHGHLSDRYTKTGGCVVCVQASNKAGRSERKRQTSPQARAEQEGLPTYNTGEPCSRGHLSDRYTSNRHCVACVRENWRDLRDRGPRIGGLYKDGTA